MVSMKRATVAAALPVGEYLDNGSTVLR